MELLVLLASPFTTTHANCTVRDKRNRHERATAVRVTCGRDRFTCWSAIMSSGERPIFRRADPCQVCAKRQRVAHARPRKSYRPN